MKFRQWLHHQWFDHCAEFEGWFKRTPDYTMQDYFNRYRWWLKQQYRKQQGK